MRAIVRAYLLKNTPKTMKPIVDGTSGELSKVEEEYEELRDAWDQNLKPPAFIDGCDLVDATLKLQWNKFKVPAPLILVVIYLRRLYKPIRNRIYDYAGLNKEDFNS